MSSYILGLSAYFHDSSAAILKDGEVIAAAQEERFTRVKHDSSFPYNAICFCLEEANIYLDEVEYIVFYDKPILKFDRILSNFLNYAPLGVFNFVKTIPVYLNKLFVSHNIKNELKDLGYNKLPKILYAEHHESHAAAAFFPSPYSQAAILCVDGVGEWATTTAWVGDNNKIQLLWQINYPHSLGLLYSAFTFFIGFKVNSGEYKLMGLAPYGDPIYVDIIENNLIKIKSDGSFMLNLKFFDYMKGNSMVNHRFEKLFGIKARKPSDDIKQIHMDIASSIQKVTENVITKLVNTLSKDPLVNTKNLCLAGGVALNCVANSKILKNTPFENTWIQPAAGDAGSGLGAAYLAWHHYKNEPRYSDELYDKMKGAYLGPHYSNSQINNALQKLDAIFEYYEQNELVKRAAECIASNAVVGWFQGPMEFGPRALGNRSILGNPTKLENQSFINLKIKYRESFRPFAPAVITEKQHEYFELTNKSPYMLLVSDVAKKQLVDTKEAKGLKGLDKLYSKRSSIPAVTHIDNSARVQTVMKETNPLFYQLIVEFEKQSGCPVVINTSFNVRGEPVVCTPEDAYKCFMMTDMDYLVIGNYFLAKSEQKNKEIYQGMHENFELD